MVFKFIAILAFVGVASASLIRSDLGWNAESELIRTIEEHGSNPQYTYTYGVEDALTGDSKSQIETRDGDVVHGEYSLNDADGFRRTVKYTADALNGFNAVVDRKPLLEAAPVAVKSVEHIAAPVAVKAIEPIAAPVFTKAVLPVAAPALVKTIAPVTYAAPTLIKSIPFTYSAPTLIKSATFAYAPAHIRSVSAFEPTLAYSSVPAIHKPVHFGYSAPTLVKDFPLSYAGSAAYTTQSFRSLPKYSQW